MVSYRGGGTRLVGALMAGTQKAGGCVAGRITPLAPNRYWLAI